MPTGLTAGLRLSPEDTEEDYPYLDRKRRFPQTLSNPLNRTKADEELTLPAPPLQLKPDGSINWWAMLAPLITTGIGALAGGKTGALLGAQAGASGLKGYVEGMELNRQRRLQEEEMGIRREHEERRTTAAERAATAAERKAEAEAKAFKWDPKNRIFTNDMGDIKHPAPDMVKEPPAERRGVWSEARGTIIYPDEGEYKVLEGLPPRQFAPAGISTTPVKMKDPATGEIYFWRYDPTVKDSPIPEYRRLGKAPPTGKQPGADDWEEQMKGMGDDNILNAPAVGLTAQEEARLKELGEKAKTQGGSLEGADYEEYERLRKKRLGAKNATR